MCKIQQPCRHLDLDGDGYISVDEVDALLAELGVPKLVSEQPSTAESLTGVTSPSTALLTAGSASHKITFTQFLQLHHQVKINKTNINNEASNNSNNKSIDNNNSNNNDNSSD